MSDATDAQDKTEDATPRRRQEARERGQVAMSQERLTTLTLSASATILSLGGGRLASHCGALVRASVMQLAVLGTQDIDAMGWARLMSESLRPMALPIGFIVVPLVLVTL